MAYIFYLDGIALPVTPSRLNIVTKNKNGVSTLLNGEEISILKSPGLREISFEALFPQKKYPFAYYPDGFLPANFYLAKFELLKREKKPFYFLASRTNEKGRPLFDTNILVSLEDMAITENAESGTDCTVSFKLKEYKSAVLKEYSVASNAAKVVTREVKTPAKSYTVKKGDCLYNICKTELGNGNLYKEIAKLNGIKNPNLIYPGQVIYFG